MTLSEGCGSLEAMKRGLARLLAQGLAADKDLLRAIARVHLGAVGTSVPGRKRIGKPLPGGVGQAEASRRGVGLPRPEGVVGAEASRRGAGKAATGPIAHGESMARDLGVSRETPVGVSGASTRGPGLAPAEAVGSGEATRRGVGLQRPEAVDGAEASSRQPGLGRSERSGVSGISSRSPGKPFAGGLSQSALARRQAGVAETGAVGAEDTTSRKLALSLEESPQASHATGRSIAHGLASGVGAGSGVSRDVSRETLGQVGQRATAFRWVGSEKREQVSQWDVMGRRVGIAFAPGFSCDEEALLALGMALCDAVEAGAGATRYVGLAHSEGQGLSEAVVRQVGARIEELLAVDDLALITWTAVLIITEAVSVSEGMRRHLTTALADLMAAAAANSSRAGLSRSEVLGACEKASADLRVALDGAIACLDLAEIINAVFLVIDEALDAGDSHSLAVGVGLVEAAFTSESLRRAVGREFSEWAQIAALMAQQRGEPEDVALEYTLLLVQEVMEVVAEREGITLDLTPTETTLSRGLDEMCMHVDGPALELHELARRVDLEDEGEV